MPNISYNMTELRIKLVKEIVAKKRKIKEVCEILDISRQSVSKWKAKYIQEWEAWLIPKKSWPKKGTCWNKTPEWLEQECCRIGEENPFMGPIGISDEILDTYEVKINQSTVYQILKRNKVRYYKGYHWTRKKKKRYVKDIPGRELQLDVSFPYWYQRKICVYTAIDDASRFVISKIYTRHLSSSSIDFVKHVIANSHFKIHAFRTDQWREFSRELTMYLKKQWIEHNKNPPYTPQHNGKVERYHRTMKENCCIYWRFDASIEELNYNLRLWTDYYNSRKKHYWLWMNGLTPEKMLQKFNKLNPLLMPNL